METWEYKILPIDIAQPAQGADGELKQIEDALNIQGRDRWELVLAWWHKPAGAEQLLGRFVLGGAGDNLLCVFKRRK